MVNHPTPDGATHAGIQVSIRNVTKRFGSFTALKDISIDIRKGEFLTLLGSSGSGKSTFLNILAGFEFPTSGQILQGTNDLSAKTPEERNFGMVFQGYALFPHLTVTQNIAFPLRIRKVPLAERKKRVGEILERVGLSAHADKYPSQMSGGQQQRVALARALVFSPHILLLDEPFSALDKNLREQLQFEVKRIHRDFNSTFVFVTHDQSEALSMSDRIAIFEHGQLMQIDTPQAIYNRPASEFVAGFLGQINLLPLQDARQEAGWTTGRFGGTALRAPGVSATGARIAVRPEHARLDRQAEIGGRNAVPVQIRGVAYRGSSVALDLVTPEDPSIPLFLSIPAAEWDEGASATGAPLWLSWEPGKSLLIPQG